MKTRTISKNIQEVLPETFNGTNDAWVVKTDIKENCVDLKDNDDDRARHRDKHGLSIGTAGYLMIAQMAGAGFLALPRAMADVGWVGLVLLTIICFNIGFAATRLARSWVMLEEQFPEYRKPVRQPYAIEAYEALGHIGRKLARISIIVGNIGSSTVYIILMSGLLNSLYPTISSCEYTLIVAACLAPFTWYGSPKDFWFVSVFAVFSTVLTIAIIMSKIITDFALQPDFQFPEHPNPTFNSFCLGFGAIIFSIGGMPVFPTIQNDMKVRKDFWKGAVFGFCSIYVLYLPVTVMAYVYIGGAVDSNVILSLEPDPVLTAAIIFQIFNLMGTYVISLNPVFQSLEDVLGVPHHFGAKRLLLRNGIVLLEVIIALSFPDFGLFVNLIGGSTLTIISFILPPLIYLKLNERALKERWTISIKEVPLWQKLYLWEILIVGSIGGVAATVTSLYALLRPEKFQDSCFANFTN